MGGAQRRLTVRWCPPMAAWALDVANADGTPVINGIPLVTGIDLLMQYAYLNLGGKLVCQSGHNAYAVTTFENLGLTAHLFFIVS